MKNWTIAMATAWWSMEGCSALVVLLVLEAETSAALVLVETGESCCTSGGTADQTVIFSSAERSVGRPRSRYVRP